MFGMRSRCESADLRVALAAGLLALGASAGAAAAAEDVEPIDLPTGQHKRVHEKVLTALLDGQTAGAVAALEQYQEKHPDSAETLFMLAAGQARLGKPDEAMAAAKAAVEAGLPIGRFHAGPAPLLDALWNQEAFHQWVEEKGPPLVHGPMVGDVTATGASIWVRTASPTAVRVVADGPDGTTVRSTRVETTERRDRTGVVRLSGLSPDTRYRYRVLVDGERARPRFLEGGGTLAFRTMPAEGEPSAYRIAFGGGAGYVPKNERVWQTIRARDPRAVLLLGDNVYIDHPKSRPMQRYCYYRRQSRPEFRQLVSSAGIYSIWDDHDFGTNDCWGGPKVDEPAWKPKVWEVFRQNWVNPAYGGGKAHPGCYYKFSIGDVDYFLLDCRYYRENPRRKRPSMLGPEQKAWLKKQVAASTATFKVLISSVPWDFHTKGDSPDTWNGYREERHELFRFLHDERIEGVVLMSADRHRSDLLKIGRDDGYDLYEFNSSRLTNQHRHRELDHAVFSYNDTQSFGVVDFDTTKADPTVTYRIKTIDGKEVFSKTLRRSDLSYDAK